MAKKFNGLKIPFYPPVINSNSYQTQGQLNKFRFKRQNDSSLNSNSYINITDKTSCLQELKHISSSLINDLKNLKWLKDLEDSSRQLKTLSSSHDLNLILNKYFKSNRLFAISNFIDTNFKDFGPNEKSFIFKIFSVINQQQKDSITDEKFHNLLIKLEQDYFDNLDKCDLIDFNNYIDAFYLFRDSNLHFFSKSVDKIFRKILNELNVTKITETDDIVHDMNRQWYETFKPENSLAIGLHILNRLSLLNNDAKSVFFYNLIIKNNDRLSAENVEELASVLAFYSQNSNLIKLNSENRKLFNLLIEKNRMVLVENIDKIRSKKNKIIFVDWLSRQNFDNELLDKYKISLINYFLSETKEANTVSEFTTAIKCASILINSYNRTTQNIKNSFFRTYEPIYNKLVDKFVKNMINLKNESESIVNFKSSSRNLIKSNRKFISKSLKDEITKKYNSLYEYFDLYTFRDLILANQKGEFKWISSETISRFQSNYSYNLNSMNKEVRYLYMTEAIKMSKEWSGIQLSKKVLDSILKEYVIGMKDKTFNKHAANKDICAAINLILNNHEYSVYKFNMLEPYINNLIDQDLQYINSVIDPLVNDFYFETFPGKTSNILNKIRNKIAHKILNFSDQDNINLSEIGTLTSCLFKAKEKIKFDSNLSFEMTVLKKNLDKCLSEFDILCGIQSEMGKNEIKNLSDQVKQFETRVFKYTMALKHTSSLIQLSDDYNCRLFIDLTECVLKLLGIFYDNLFTKIIVDHQNKKNYFTKSLICDLLTLFGLYNYFDLNFICRSLNPAEKINFSQGIRELKLYNDNLYNLIQTNKKMNILQLIEYNFSLFNLNIQSTQPIIDLFKDVQSFESLIQKFSHLNSVNF